MLYLTPLYHFFSDASELVIDRDITPTAELFGLLRPFKPGRLRAGDTFLLFRRGETGGWRIRREGDLFDVPNLTINANEFLATVKSAIEAYAQRLRGAEWDEDIWKNCGRRWTPLLSIANIEIGKAAASWCARLNSRQCSMSFEDYKIVLYRQDDGSWVAEIPSLPGCYALMPTRAEALSELGGVFHMIAEEYKEKGLALPADTTEVVHA